jgi:hypothetical protein
MTLIFDVLYSGFTPLLPLMLSLFWEFYASEIDLLQRQQYVEVKSVLLISKLALERKEIFARGIQSLYDATPTLIIVPNLANFSALDKLVSRVFTGYCWSASSLHPEPRAFPNTQAFPTNFNTMISFSMFAPIDT